MHKRSKKEYSVGKITETHVEILGIRNSNTDRPITRASLDNFDVLECDIECENRDKCFFYNLSYGSKITSEDK